MIFQFQLGRELWGLWRKIFSPCIHMIIDKSNWVMIFLKLGSNIWYILIRLVFISLQCENYFTTQRFVVCNPRELIDSGLITQREPIHQLKWAVLSLLTCTFLFFQVWFKNRRAKCRQQQKAKDGNSKSPTPKKAKSPPPPSISPVGGYSKPTPVSSPLTNGSMNAPTSIWSPASIAPVNDIMYQNSCMQRPGSYPMSNMHAGYSHQNYGPSSYYGNSDYLSPMQLPVMHSNQANTMSNSFSNQYAALPPSAQSLSRPAGGDCLEYKDTTSWSKYQVL